MTADVKALREILPQLEKAEGRLDDDLLGRLLCALRGWNYVKFRITGTVLMIVAEDFKIIEMYRDRCPDCDLTAADTLVRELGFIRFSGPADNGCLAAAKLTRQHFEYDPVVAYHGSSEHLAILITLTKAVLAMAEQETL